MESDSETDLVVRSFIPDSLDDFLLAVPRGPGTVLLPFLSDPVEIPLGISRVVQPKHAYAGSRAPSCQSLDIHSSSVTKSANQPGPAELTTIIFWQTGTAAS